MLVLSVALNMMINDVLIVTASDYTQNTVKPAYAALIESFGGEDTDEWTAEAVRLVAEHEGAKAAAAKVVAQSGGDVARIMASQKDKWTHDMWWLATMDIHTLIIMVSGNAGSAAAHAQNECRLGSEEMADWYKSKFDMQNQLADIYRYILARCSQFEELHEFTQDEMIKKRSEDLSNVYKTRTAVKDSLIRLFKPFVKLSVFPWTNLAKVLVQHRLVITNFVPDLAFPGFGSSYSDNHSTDEFKALYYALEETSPDRKITVSRLDNWPEGDPEDVALITDKDGKVILSLQGAKDGLAKKGMDESTGGSKVSVSGLAVKRRGMDVSLGGGGQHKRQRGPHSMKGLTSGSEGVSKRKPKGARIPKSAALISDEDNESASDNIASWGRQTSTAVSEEGPMHSPPVAPVAPSWLGPLGSHLVQPRQPRPKPRYSEHPHETNTAVPTSSTPLSIGPDWTRFHQPSWNPSELFPLSLGTDDALDSLAACMDAQEFNIHSESNMNPLNAQSLPSQPLFADVPVVDFSASTFQNPYSSSTLL